MGLKSIVWFQRALFTALAIDLVNNLWRLREPPTMLASKGLQPSPAVILGVSVLSPLIGVILWYFVARKRSNVARWIMTVLVVLAVIGFAARGFRDVDVITRPVFWIAAFAELLKVAAVSCLFRASAAGWFTRARA